MSESTKASDMAQDTDAANAVADMIGAFLLDLEAAGWPPNAILAGAHSQIVATMTATIGGPMTAYCCGQAAERVRHLPSFSASSLAFTPPRGTA